MRARGAKEARKANEVMTDQSYLAVARQFGQRAEHELNELDEVKPVSAIVTIPAVAYDALFPPNYPTDPRADLATDSDRWRVLLVLAWQHDYETVDGLYGALEGVRACGARLEPIGATGVCRLTRGAQIGEPTWAGWRSRYLVQHGAVLTRLLQQLPKVETREVVTI